MYKFIHSNYLSDEPNDKTYEVLDNNMIINSQICKLKIHDKYLKIREKIIGDVYSVINKMINDEIDEKIIKNKIENVTHKCNKT